MEDGGGGEPIMDAWSDAVARKVTSVKSIVGGGIEGFNDGGRRRNLLVASPICLVMRSSFKGN